MSLLLTWRIMLVLYTLMQSSRRLCDRPRSIHAMLLHLQQSTAALTQWSSFRSCRVAQKWLLVYSNITSIPRTKYFLVVRLQKSSTCYLFYFCFPASLMSSCCTCDERQRSCQSWFYLHLCFVCDSKVTWSADLCAIRYMSQVDTFEVHWSSTLYSTCRVVLLGAS